MTTAVKKLLVFKHCYVLSQDVQPSNCENLNPCQYVSRWPSSRSTVKVKDLGRCLQEHYNFIAIISKFSHLFVFVLLVFFRLSRLSTSLTVIS